MTLLSHTVPRVLKLLNTRVRLPFTPSMVVSVKRERAAELVANSDEIAQYGGQPGNYGGPQAGSPAGYGGSPMGYAGPQSAGGYGRGQQPPNAEWAQPRPGQNFNNGFGGYQA